jgi:hypothetical protein
MTDEEMSHLLGMAVDVEIKLREDREPDIIRPENEMKILLEGADDAYYERVGVGNKTWWV